MQKLSSHDAAQGLARTGGAVLGGLSRAVGALRPTAKPLHPRGDVVRGMLERHGSEEITGVPLLDQPGSDEVTVRLSRAAGLPAPLPDIHGLALRVPIDDVRFGDLLLASTGLGALNRFVLTPAQDRLSRPMTTLLPYATPTGQLLLAAVPRPGEEYDLLWARPRGDWHRWARLTLDRPHGADALLSFDPVTNPLPGLEQPEWVRRLREPAYRAARRSRG